MVQPAPSGTIAFIGDGNNDVYTKYNAFIDFISAEPLKLIYCPATTEYTMEVTVPQIEKTEINEDGYLDCDIKFTGLTPWYKTVTFDYLTGKGLTPSTNLYPRDNLPPRESGVRTISYYSNGTMKSPAKLKIYGPITNPRWVYTTGGKTYDGKLKTSISSSQMIIVDATSDTYTIMRAPISNEANTTNIYNTSDFSTKRFVEFERGANNFRLYAEGAELANTTRVILEIMECHETV
jgi:hypothetical protein